MHHDVVRRVQWFSIPVIGQNTDGAVVLKSDHPSRVMFARDQPAFEIEGAAVGVVRGLPEHAHVSIFIDASKLAIVGDIAPNQISSAGVPGTAFGPARAGPEPLNGCVDDLVASKPIVEDNDP